MRIPFNCDNCGKMIMRKPRYKHHFCNAKCKKAYELKTGKYLNISKKTPQLMKIEELAKLREDMRK